MISIIIPLYNKEDVVITTLQSVKNQSYTDWECIIVDDGSKDNSSQVVKDYIMSDSRFCYYQKENGGPSSARNFGVKKARYNWIIFLDADDMFEDGALAHFAELLQDHPDYRMYCCNFFVDKKGERTLYSKQYKDGEIKNNFRSWFEGSLMPCQGTTIYDRELLLEHPLNERLRRFEDASMLFDIMRTEKIYRSSYPTFTYVRGNSAASVIRDNFKEDFFAYLEPKGKPFWEQVILYQYYKAAFVLYGRQANETYPSSPFNTCMQILIVVYLKFLNITSRIKKIICY